MKHLLLILMAGIALSMAACKGEDGQDGQDGAQGPAGNANVTSFVTTYESGTWLPNGTAGDPGFTIEFTANVPGLTNDIYANGLVMVYIADNYYSPYSSDHFVALPYTYVSPGGGYTSETAAHYVPGAVTIRRYDSDNYAVTSGGTLKIVMATADGLKQNPDLDWTDYAAVADALKIAE